MSSLANHLDIGLLFLFFSPVSLPSSCLVFRLVFSCRPSVGPSAGHIVGLIVPANSNLVPSGLGLRPERMFVSFHFSFLSLPFCVFPIWPSQPPFPGIRIYHGYVPGIVSAQVIWDGTPQLASAVPLRTDTAVHALFLLSTIETLFVACFVTVG